MSGEVVALQQRRPDARPFVRPVPRERADLFDHTAERAVLAAVFLAENGAHEVLDRVLTLVSAASFHEVRHTRVMEAMVALRGRGEPIDFVTVPRELQAMNCLHAVGGPQFVGGLTDDLPTGAFVDAHARIVAEHAARRRMREYALALADRAGDLGRPLADVRDRAAEAIQRIAVPGVVARPIGDDLEGLYAEHERRRAGVEAPALSTGLKDLDRCLGGGYRPGVHFIVARPRIGKTPLALQMALHCAQHIGPAYVLSKEIVRRELARAAMANVGGIALDRLQDAGKMTERDRAQWTLGAQKLGRLPLLIQDLEEPGCPSTAGEIGAAVEAYSAATRQQVRLVVVDHFLKIKTGRRVFDRRAEVEEVSDALRCLAVRLGIPVVVLVHSRRSKPERGLWKLPTMEDIAESDAPARDASSIVLLHREDYYPTRKYDDAAPPMAGLVDVFVPKVRGSAGAMKCRLRFHGHLQRWTGVEAEPGLDDQPELATHAPAFDDDDREPEVAF